MRRILLSLPFVLLTLLFALPALAGNWGENWGEMVWEVISAPVPTMGLLGLTVFAMVLAATAVWALRKRRPALGLTLTLTLIAIPLAVAAGTLTVPNTFVNGTPADAGQINANFDAVEAEVNDNDGRISTAQSTADTAATFAATAQNAATTAGSLAATAQGSANTAITNAAAAQNTADTAITNAAAAQGTANTAVANAAAAQNTAGTAITNAAAAQNTADGAVTDAAAAQGTANTAVTNAATAQGTADGAVTDAATAQAGANAAAADAAAVLGTANTAASDAAAALAAANAADAILSTYGPHARAGLWTTAVGVGALENNTGGQNTAMGNGALGQNTIGSENTAIGQAALNNLQPVVGGDGDYNTALGLQALGYSTDGSWNTAIGNRALVFNYVGDQNTAVGFHALRNSKGSRNIALGYQAGLLIGTGDDNILIGNEGDGVDGENGTIRIGTPGTHTETLLSGKVEVNDPASSGSGRIILDPTAVGSGYSTTLSMDDTGMKLGHDSSVRDIQFQTDSTTRMTIEADGAVKLDHSSALYDVWIQGGSSTSSGNARNLAILGRENTDTLVLNYGAEYTGGTEIQSTLTVTGGCINGSFCSDARLKVNIQPLDEPVLDEVLQLQASTYQWRDDLEKGTQIGLVAQEVEKLFPEVVSTGSDGLQKGLSCTGLNALTIQAVKELKAEKDAEIAALHRSNAEMQERLALVEGLSVRLMALEAQVDGMARVVRAETGTVGPLAMRRD